MPGPGGSVIPKIEYAVLIRQFGTQAFGRARQIFTEQLGGAPLGIPSSFRDLLSDELRPVIDRFYFRSVYFREPSGVLFEIATIGPGFAVDEDAAHLGERLSLPPSYEPLRARLEGILKPLPYPRPPLG